jgi:hypothetical protein
MTNAYTAFRRIQVSNEEGTPGTAEAATEIVSGTTYSAAFSDLEIHKPEQDRNILSMNLSDDFVVGKLAEMTLEGNLNTRIACWLFCNAVRGNISPTQPDAINQPNAYLWTIQPGLTTSNTPDITNGIDTFTFEVGDNVQAHEIEYCFATSISVSGSPNEPVTYTWEITGRQMTNTTFTAALSVVAVQYFASNQVNFYIDTSYATIGTTEVKDLLREFTFTLDTGFTPRFTSSSSLLYQGVNETKKMVTLDATYLRGTNSEAERVKYNARTTTYLRIAIMGQTELDSGESNPPYIYIDGAFRYFEWNEPDDDEGMQYVSVTAESVYDPTGAKEYEIAVYTDLAAFP